MKSKVRRSLLELRFLEDCLWGLRFFLPQRVGEGSVLRLFEEKEKKKGTNVTVVRVPSSSSRRQSNHHRNIEKKKKKKKERTNNETKRNFRKHCKTFHFLSAAREPVFTVLQCQCTSADSSSPFFLRPVVFFWSILLVQNSA